MDEVRLRVIELLMEGEQSGQAIAERLGVSRAAVWKHLKAWQDQGLAIAGSPRRGYRLLEKPDFLFPQRVHAGLTTRQLGQNLDCHFQVDSTNLRAKQLARQGAPHGTLVLTERQTGGRGRMQRSWSSPPGGIYLSLVLRPELPPQQAFRVTMIAAVALREAIAALGADAAIKWPNDVLVGGRKVCGMLSELDGSMERVEWLVVGIGINANVEPEELPGDALCHATTLKGELGHPVERIALVNGFLCRLEALLAQPFSGVAQAYREHMALLGKSVRIIQGERVRAGVLEAVDDEGALLLREEGGALTRVLAGDVSLRGETAYV